MKKLLQGLAATAMLLSLLVAVALAYDQADCDDYDLFHLGPAQVTMLDDKQKAKDFMGEDCTNSQTQYLFNQKFSQAEGNQSIGVGFNSDGADDYAAGLWDYCMSDYVLAKSFYDLAAIQFLQAEQIARDCMCPNHPTL